ncbi:adhesion G-protein coupled receptor G2 [Corythoichthys intestinalis]|uniref:adhesion G-protein coupled receptor G2 n=1 Tax=Corythoichthys intestinalis TaxID=161448 RepID=UPI0025A5F80B|nr:adhesion G-protein coupled receptor G2 [Corythoichthys intestinalis]
MDQIFPQNCLENLTVTIYGEYFWPETYPQETQVMGCRKPSSQRAFRLCKLHIENDTTSWANPDMSDCEPIVGISDLDNITVTTDNAAEVVDIIQDLINTTLGNSTQIPPAELKTVVEKLNQVVNVTTVTPALGSNIVQVFSDILISDTDMAPVADSILNLTDTMGNTMDLLGESLSLTAPSLALSMVNVDSKEFNGLTFSADSVSSSQRPNVSINQSFEGKPIPGSNATISLPSSLHSFLPPGQQNKTRVQFQFYGTQDLFQDPKTSNATTLNSYIVSATINGSHVNNLANGERVVITLRHLKAKQSNHEVLCVFWDFQENGGRGGWSDMGCETQSLLPDQTRCLCEHLTHFAVLLDVSRTPISEADSQMLTVISYVGCGLSSIFLGITLLTYLAFAKLRRDYPSKILINLSVALLGLNMLFLVDSWLASFSNYSLCIVTAVALHYFLLASFTWMALEAIHMYFALVKVFNTYVPAYILKFCAIGWGVPLVVVSLVLLIDKDAYGNTIASAAASEIHSADQFCWLQDNAVFYATVVALVLLVLLVNMSMFVVVLLQIRKMGANKKAANNSRGTLQNLRAVASLTVLLGLTWLTGFFSFGPGRVVLMYLFTIFNTLQGFFVFLFHCLMKENVRKQWRMQFCCGAPKSSDCSGFSKTTSSLRKKEHRVNSSVNTSTLSNALESDAELKTGRGHKRASHMP